MDSLSLKLPKRLHAKLAAAARRRRLSKSAIAREALETCLSGKNGGPRPSALEMIGDLVGCLKGGPRDLSYNKKHMRGYGR